MTAAAPVLLAALVAGGVPAIQEEDAGRRWIVRLRLQAATTLQARVDGHRVGVRAWASEEAAEVVVRLGERVFLVDLRQALLFQLPDDAVEPRSDRLELLLPYPAPVTDEPLDDLVEAVQLSSPRVEAGRVRLRLDGELDNLHTDRSSGLNYLHMPVEEYREVFRIAFRGGERLYEVLFPDVPG